MTAQVPPPLCIAVIRALSIARPTCGGTSSVRVAGVTPPHSAAAPTGRRPTPVNAAG